MSTVRVRSSLLASLTWEKRTSISILVCGLYNRFFSRSLLFLNFITIYQWMTIWSDAPSSLVTQNGCVPFDVHTSPTVCLRARLDECIYWQRTCVVCRDVYTAQFSLHVARRDLIDERFTLLVRGERANILLFFWQQKETTFALDRDK